MKFLKFNTYEEMSAAAANIMAEQIKSKPNSVLGLATGSTPVGMYKKLIEMNKAGEIDFSDITTVNLDEYYPIDPANNQSYRYFMNDNLFNHINIDMDRTNVLYGLAEDPDKECERYEQLIKDLGGIDIQVLGIGQNGHIAFNEPEENLYLNTHKTALTESTIQANSRFFSEGEIMPTASLTMGMGTIFAAKKIILLINGKAKKAAFEQLLNDRFCTSCPATILKLHPDVTVICDAEVAD
ncbi:MAG: glucosamine-6-phosphate deaminase [Clostridia bacterium]|nr:glucosamine-6-phosphate deaminase [Clostridia bacterium]